MIMQQVIYLTCPTIVTVGAKRAEENVLENKIDYALLSLLVK